jgi:hypothetical protein
MAAVTATRFRRTSRCRSPRAGSAASATYSLCWPWTSATAAPAKDRDTGSTAAIRTVPPGLGGASRPCRGHRRVPYRGGQRGGCAAHPRHRPIGDRGRFPTTAITVWRSAQGPARQLIGGRVQSNQICAHRRPRRQSQVAAPIRTPRALLVSRLDHARDLLADGQTGGQADGATWDGAGAARRGGWRCRCVRQ